MSREGTGTLGLLRSQLAAFPAAFAFVLVAALLATIPGIAVPLLVRAYVDEYLVGGNGEWAAAVTVAMLVALVVTVALVWLQYVAVSRLAVQLSASDSIRFAWHVLRLPVPAVQRIGTGDLAARSGSTQSQAFTAGMLLPLALANVVTLVVYAIGLVLISAPLGLASVLVVAGSMAATLLLLRGRRASQRLADDESVALSAETSSMVAGIETVKAVAWEQWVFDRWGQRNARATSAASALAVSGQRLGVVPPMTQAIGLGLMLVLGAYLVFYGLLSLGTLVAAQALLVALLVPAGQLAWMGTLLEAVGSVRRQLRAITDLPLDPEALTLAAPAGDTASEPMSLALRDAVFGYDGEKPPLLDGLSVEVPAGKWLAVVGSSGSGKSTLAKLVVGETQPWSGAVLLDGVPRLDLPRSERSARVGYVPQHPVLMPGSITENVTMFDESIPLEHVRAALADAFILDTIMARPGGLDEQVSPTGHGFSGGELQRIAIARALVRAPSLLVLDEATSALDPVVEAELGAALRARGCTCVLVAHRLSTVRDADLIIVLESGRVVQQGRFDELSTHGAFAELVHG